VSRSTNRCLDLASDHKQLIGDIRAQLGKEASVSAIVIDTLNRSLAGSESSDDDMGNYVRACDAMREAFRCAVVVVHHCGHNANRPRGHTSLLGAADAQIAIKRNADGPIVVTVEYMKDGPTGAEIICGLKVVELGLDADGDLITSCVIEPIDDASPGAGRKPTKLNAQSQVALDMLRRAIDEAGQVPPGTAHMPTGLKAVISAVWRRYCDNGTVSSSDKPDSKLKAFKRAADNLQAVGIIGTASDWVWIIPDNRTDRHPL
jgi:AAA domain